jgi:hypothetical protein
MGRQNGWTPEPDWSYSLEAEGIRLFFRDVAPVQTGAEFGFQRRLPFLQPGIDLLLIEPGVGEIFWEGSNHAKHTNI